MTPRPQRPQRPFGRTGRTGRPTTGLRPSASGHLGDRTLRTPPRAPFGRENEVPTALALSSIGIPLGRASAAESVVRAPFGLRRASGRSLGSSTAGRAVPSPGAAKARSRAPGRARPLGALRAQPPRRPGATDQCPLLNEERKSHERPAMSQFEPLRTTVQDRGFPGQRKRVSLLGCRAIAANGPVPSTPMTLREGIILPTANSQQDSPN
jgi:hypothetical protein